MFFIANDELINAGRGTERAVLTQNDIKNLHKSFLAVVAPGGKLTTAWGALKSE